MEKERNMSKWLLLNVLIVLMSCSLKKEKITISSDTLQYGIKFKKKSITYFSSKPPEKLGTIKEYTLSFTVNVENQDTLLKCYADCYNLNDIKGQYFIRLSFKIEKFRGAGIYYKNNFSTFFDFSNDISPVYSHNSYDGYIQLNTFNWQTKKGEGNFYIKLFDTSNYYKDTIYITGGYFIF